MKIIFKPGTQKLSTAKRPLTGIESNRNTIFPRMDNLHYGLDQTG